MFWTEYLGTIKDLNLEISNQILASLYISQVYLQNLALRERILTTQNISSNMPSFKLASAIKTQTSCKECILTLNLVLSDSPSGRHSGRVRGHLGRRRNTNCVLRHHGDRRSHVTVGFHGNADPDVTGDCLQMSVRVKKEG